MGETVKIIKVKLDLSSIQFYVSYTIAKRGVEVGIIKEESESTQFLTDQQGIPLAIFDFFEIEFSWTKMIADILHDLAFAIMLTKKKTNLF